MFQRNPTQWVTDSHRRRTRIELMDEDAFNDKDKTLHHAICDKNAWFCREKFGLHAHAIFPALTD